MKIGMTGLVFTVSVTYLLSTGRCTPPPTLPEVPVWKVQHIDPGTEPLFQHLLGGSRVYSQALDVDGDGRKDNIRIYEKPQPYPAIFFQRESASLWERIPPEDPRYSQIRESL